MNLESLLLRKITITGYDHENPRECLRRWNNVVSAMDSVCEEVFSECHLNILKSENLKIVKILDLPTQVGESRCLRIKYEQLVLHPRLVFVVFLIIGHPR